MSKLSKEVFLEFYNKYYSDTKIAKEFKICRKEVSKLRKSLNLPVMYQYSKYTNQLTSLVKDGLSDYDISEIMNISKSYVNYIRKKLKLKANFEKRVYKTKTDSRKGKIIGNLKFSAKRRNLEFNLVYTDLELPKYCPILGHKLQYGFNPNNLLNASVDRIDNSKGYIKGNVIIISRLANLMKSSANLEDLQLFIDNYQKLINYYKNHSALGSITDIFPNTEMYEEV